MSNSHNSQFLHDQISTSDFGFPIGVLLEHGWLYPGNFGFPPLVFFQKMIDCTPEKFKNNPYPPVYVSANMCVSHSGRCFGVSSHVWLRLETVVCNPHYWSRFLDYCYIPTSLIWFPHYRSRFWMFDSYIPPSLVWFFKHICIAQQTCMRLHERLSATVSPQSWDLEWPLPPKKLEMHTCVPVSAYPSHCLNIQNGTSFEVCLRNTFAQESIFGEKHSYP